MHRKELPRIYEIIDLVNSPESPHAYFKDFDDSITAQPVKRKHFKDIEAELQGLGDAAWEYLKVEAARCFEQKDNTRGWQQAFDRLNEAKGYNYLIDLGCRRVEFIPRSEKRRQQTPDLKGALGSATILCDVKTINPSDAESKARRQEITARETQTSLSASFFEKLSKTLKKAKRQMDRYCSGIETRKIVYVVINFDDLLHEYVETYSEQLAGYEKNAPVPGIEIVFDIKPAFYSATA